MPDMTITDLLSALHGGILRAQVQTLLATREYVSTFAGDEILRLFHVPSFTFETITVEVPIAPVQVKAAQGPVRADLSTTLRIKHGRYAAAQRARLVTALQERVKLSQAQAEAAIEAAGQRDVPVFVTTDTGHARRLAQALRAAGAVVSTHKEVVNLKPRELIVSTDLPENARPLTLRLEIKPAPLRLVRDPEEPGDAFLLEAPNR
jgi:hypothetical protein